MIFGSKNKKLDPSRRFGSRDFRAKVRRAQHYRRPFIADRQGFFSRIFGSPKTSLRVWKFLLLASVVITFYYLVIAQYFLVTDITVLGYNQISEEQIKQTLTNASQSRTFLIPKNHLLLLSQGRVNKLITENIPLIREVSEAKRGWPNRLELTVLERQPGFLFQVKGRMFLVDEDGVVIKEAVEMENLPQVLDLDEEDVVVGEVLPNPKLVAFIISMDRAWTNRISSDIAQIEVPSKSSYEVHFRSTEGWVVFFDINRATMTQLGNLALILSRQIPPADRERLAYIDLRLETWVYYCFDNTPCSSAPQQNLEETNEKQQP
ncbi:MAG: FtsQ-type POTRA domain-containing protein [Candidatus Doudnabacteria bacterium]|nr:FtsQ-type POTRA domain-containing protein [Candidatus Doudnabacteria bacterium]